MANKQISRIKSAITGEEYDLVTRYQDETMSIKLSCADDITWENYKVIVQNITTGAYSEHTLLATGECSFAIPMGETYEVTLPTVGDTYEQPLSRIFVAQVGFRSISYEYVGVSTKEEQVSIIIKIKTTTAGGAMSDIAGNIVTATLSDGQTKTATISDSGTATLTIPYGVYYTLSFPTVTGYTHDHTHDTFLAGIPSRNEVVFYYLLSSDIDGVYGIDSDGEPHSLAAIQAMSDEEKAKIVLGAFNTAELGDNGFCWKIKEPCGPIATGASSPLVSKPWANNNSLMLVDSEGKYKPLNQLDENCPFYNEGLSNDAGGQKYFNNGSEYTDLILKAAEEMIAAGTAPTNFTTPAATYCREQTLTIAGVTKKGFLPAYGQLRRLSINFNDLQALYNALGIATATINYTPTITSGFWWTSCQYSSTNAVYLSNGSFISGSKTYSDSVLVCYDL